MAATRLIALHIGKGKTAARSIKERIEYTLNPDKTEEGRYVTAYECDSELAWREFTIAREMYQMEYDNSEKNDIIGYHIRQSFKPGEITPEEANQVGYETVMRFTKGKHAFTVSTHVDKEVRDGAATGERPCLHGTSSVDHTGEKSEPKERAAVLSDGRH